MILICGASGLVGNELCHLLDNNKIDYIGTYNKRKINQPNMFKVDFHNPILLEEFLTNHKITSCVFCIVERLTDICEVNWPETKKTNIDLVHITSYLCNKLNIQFIHLSTDYVFDGSVQPNSPMDKTNPLQNYGISKLISEMRVIKNCGRHCIIRTPVLYSNLCNIHENAVGLIGKNIMDLREKKYKEDNYSIRRPLYVADLCLFIKECIHNNYIGVYHFYNPYNRYTKYEICKIIGDYLELSIDKIIPMENKSDGIAPRPFDTQLTENKIDIYNYAFNSFNKTIEQCFGKFKHPKITIENKGGFFIMLDMDGTIIDSNLAHYNSYKKVFENHGQEFLNISEWNNIILNGNIDNYLKTCFNEREFDKIKTEKRNNLLNETIDFTKNSDIFLRFLIENGFNFCVVTNTSKESVEIFKHKLPLLNDIKQWIYRKDYILPKPDSECYELAKKKYYKNEKYIIGIEDSMVGYKALKEFTELIYIYDNEDIFNTNDCYLFNDFNLVYSKF